MINISYSARGMFVHSNYDCKKAFNKQIGLVSAPSHNITSTADWT